MKVRLGAKGRVSLIPDAGLLSAKSTHFPVYVDPSWQPVTESSPSFTYVQQAYPNTSHWSESGARLGVGYQGWSSPYGIERAYYQFDVGNVTDGDINSATLNATEVYSADFSCTTKYKVDVVSVNHISSATTWNAQPSRFSDVTSAQVGGANANGGCATTVPFTADVTNAVAKDGDGTLTLMLEADNDADKMAFKRTSTNPTVSVNYFPTPHHQGHIPWQKYGPIRLDDSLVANPNFSTGDLVLDATDLDIAAVGRRLRLTRSVSSFPMPTGSITNGWFADYDRTLDTGASGQVTAFGPSGELLTFKQNSGGTYAAATGFHTTLTKNSDGTFTLTHTQSGSKDTYNSAGNLTAVTDRDGNKTTVAQTLSSGQVTGFKATDSRSGRWLSLTRGADANHLTATDNSGRTLTYTTSGSVTSGNAQLSVTDTTKATTVYAYDTSGRVSQVTTPERRQTKFGYDSQNRITSLQRVLPTGSDTWTYAYSATTRATAGTTTVTDPNGHKTTYTADGDGQITKVVDALGHTRSSSYNANHDQLTAVNALGTGTANTSTYGWDSNSNLTSAKLPTGATTSLGAYTAHSGAYLPSSLTTPSGKQTSFTYNASGNLLSSQDTTGGATDGAKLSYTYQGDGTTDCGGFKGQRCSATDANGHTTKYTYDASGNLTKTAPPAPLGASTFTYDNLGRPAAVTDGRGITTTYGYDDHDRVTSVATSGGSGDLRVTYKYDGDGNLLTQTDASGAITHTYDALGREATRSLADGAVYTLAYDPAGNLQTTTDPNGTTTYGYDAGDELTSLTDPTGGKVAFAYDEDGNRKSTSYPGGTTQTAGWDNSDRPTSIKSTTASATYVDLTFDYKLADGTDTDQIQSRSNPGTGAVLSYTYDSQSRLTYARENNSSGTRTASWLYCYDKAGNLTDTSTSAGSCSDNGLTHYGYNDAGQITAVNGDSTGWSYDADGNETAAGGSNARTGETYNDFNQLTALTTGATTHHYTYAGTDSSDRLTADTTTTDEGPLGISTTSGSGGKTGFVRDPAGTLIGMTSGGKTYYYLTDNQGAPLALVDNNGTKVDSWSYSPTGTARSATNVTVPQPFGYTAAYLDDDTGLYKMGARYYDPTLGRFTQADPSGKEQNAYLYAAGDPVNRTDPTGLFSWSKFSISSAIGGIAGAVTGCVGGAITAGLVGSAAGPGGTAVGAVGGCAMGAIGAGYSGLVGGALTYTLNDALL